MRESAPMIDWDRFTQQSLETRPYRWAVIDRLYASADAAALAKTFPGDHFKRLSDYGGEKDFEYESRELIGMGASGISRRAARGKRWPVTCCRANTGRRCLR